MLSRPSSLLFLAGIASILVAPPLASRAVASPCAPVPPGLIAWWKLDGNGDDETTLHNGTVVGGSFAPGEVGQGFRSAGTGSLVTVPHSPDFNVQNFTVDAWVYVDSLVPANLLVFWKGNASGFDLSTPIGVGIYGSTERPLIAGFPFFIVTNGASEQELDATGPVTLNAWTHLAATADGTNLILYVNGVPDRIVPQTISLMTNGLPVQIGSTNNPGSLNYFSGILDEMEFHNMAATPAQILAIYEAGTVGKCPIRPTPVTPTTWGELKSRRGE